MKRAIVCLLLVAMLTAVSGCRREVKGQKVISLPEADFTLTVESEKMTDYYNQLSLRYPVVSGYDETLAAAVNEAAKQTVLDRYTREGLASEEESFFRYEITDVQVMLTTVGFYSVMVFGDYWTSESSHMEFFSYSINADLVTGRLLETTDLVRDYSTVRHLFETGTFTPSYGENVPTDTESLKALIGQYRTEYHIYPSVYFREGYMGINVEVSHVSGGYMGFEINVLDVKDSLVSGSVRDRLTTDTAE